MRSVNLRASSIRSICLISSLTAIAASGLSACAIEGGLSQRSTIAPDGPVAKAIAEAKARPGAFPNFADFPKKPTDMRKAADWDQGSAVLKKGGEELAAAARSPAEMPDPDTYAKQLRARSGLDQITPPDAAEAAALDAYARDLRERATPPPPPQ